MKASRQGGKQASSQQSAAVQTVRERMCVHARSRSECCNGNDDIGGILSSSVPAAERDFPP
jgi:hypothetical protein